LSYEARTKFSIKTLDALGFSDADKWNDKGILLYSYYKECANGISINLTEFRKGHSIDVISVNYLIELVLRKYDCAGVPLKLVFKGGISLVRDIINRIDMMEKLNDIQKTHNPAKI
jgi:hypothetical protein